MSNEILSGEEFQECIWECLQKFQRRKIHKDWLMIDWLIQSK